MDALFEATLSNVLLSLPLALAAWGLARRGGAPALVHGLWLVVLLKLVTPPLFRIPVELPGPPRAARSERVAPAEPVPFSPSITHLSPRVELEPTPAAARSEPATPLTPPATEPARTIPWRQLLLATWILGALATWMLAAQRIRLFRELLRLSARAPARIERETRELAARLGLARTPELRVVPGRLAPMLWSAGGRAQLVLPEELLPRLDGDERRTLLAHELAHFKRRDHLVRWLELAVRGLHWWNPLARWSVRGLRAAEESCCDAWVVWALPGAARTYAGALLETADFLSGAAPVPETAAGAISHVNELERRLTMILHTDMSKSLSRRGRLGLLAVALAALPFLPAFSQDPGPGDARAALDDIEMQLTDVQTRRVELADRLAQLEVKVQGLKPSHSLYKKLQVQLQELQNEASTLESVAADLAAQADFRAAALAREQADERATRLDERRAALKRGAEALMEKGDLHAAKVLLAMADELASEASDDTRRVDPRISQRREQEHAIAELLANLQRQDPGVHQPEYQNVQRWLIATKRLMEADQQADAMRAYEQALALDPALRVKDRVDPAADRMQRLEDRMDQLTDMVESLVRGFSGGGGDR